MKKVITILATVIMILTVLTSCLPGSSGTNDKGSFTGIMFEAPSISGLSGSYAWIDHEYTRNDYKVYACYSTGAREDVTESAKIEGGDHVKVSSSGSLTFSGEVAGFHKFEVKVSYGGKTKSTVIEAYKPGDIIEFTEKQTKFFEGSRVYPEIAQINYFSDTGSPSSKNNLPAKGFVTIKDKDGKGNKTTLREARTFKEGDSSISYSVYENSEVRSFNIEVVSLSNAKSLKVLSYPASEVNAGDTIDLSTFVSKYMKNCHVRIGDATEYDNSTIKSFFDATDSTGKENEGFSIKVTVLRDGKEITDGTFKKGDKIKVVVTKKISNTDSIQGEVTSEVWH